MTERDCLRGTGLSPADLAETDGLIDAFWDLAASGLQAVNASAPNSESKPVAGARVQHAFEGATRRLDCKKCFGSGKGDGFIDFIGAGTDSSNTGHRRPQRRRGLVSPL